MQVTCWEPPTIPAWVLLAREPDESAPAPGPGRAEVRLRLLRRRAYALAARLVATVPQAPRGSAVVRVPGHAPRLEPAGGWSVSVAHSWPYAAAALTAVGTLGVDVEPVGRPVDVRRLTASACGPDEAAAVTGPTELLRRWTAKEALLKAAGCGLGADPRRVELGGGAARHPRGLPADWGAAASWRVETARLAGAHLAVALGPAPVHAPTATGCSGCRS